MIKSGIYVIRNRVNDNRYVGSSIDVAGRWREHLYDLCRGKHYNQHLQRAFRLYGEEAFEFSILERVGTPGMLISREQHYIDLWWDLGILYNILPTAGSSLGVTHSEETRRKMSEAHRGITFSEEHRRKISEALMGHDTSEETRRRMSEGRKGIPHSEETRRRMSETRSGHPVSEQTRRRMSEAMKGSWTPERRREASEKMTSVWAHRRQQKQTTTA